MFLPSRSHSAFLSKLLTLSSAYRKTLGIFFIFLRLFLWGRFAHCDLSPLAIARVLPGQV